MVLKEGDDVFVHFQVEMLIDEVQHQLCIDVKHKDRRGFALEAHDSLHNAWVKNQRSVDKVLMDTPFDEDQSSVLVFFVLQERFHLGNVVPVHEGLSVDEDDGLVWHGHLVLEWEEPAIESKPVMKSRLFGERQQSRCTSVAVPCHHWLTQVNPPLQH